MGNENDLAWAAGYLTGTGSLFLLKGTTGNYVPHLRMKEVKSSESLDRFIEVLGVHVRVRLTSKQGYAIDVSSRELHRLMTQLWPYLLRGRKLEYRALRSPSA